MDVNLLNRFVRYLKPYWGKELILLLLMVLSSAGTLVSPYVLKIIIDTVFPTYNYSLLLQILFVLLGINLMRLMIGFTSDYLFEWISTHVTRDIRIDLFRHLMRLPMSFFDKTKSGDLIHRVDSEVNSIQNVLTGTVVRLINSVCSIVGLTVMLCILNYQLFLWSMLIMPFVFLNTWWFQPKIQHTIKAGREKDADILSFLMERLAHIKLVKSYVRQDEEQERLFRKIGERMILNLRSVRLTATTRNITMLFTTAVPLVIFGVGGRQVMSGTMTVGALVAFIQYMNRIFDPFRNLMGLYFDTVRALVSMRRIFDIIKISPEDTYGETHVYVRRNITFCNVDFSYHHLPVLQGLNVTLQYGKKYALVGESGCGKSTLVALLNRFYHPQRGCIRIDDKDIQEMNIHALRRRIALVTQDNQLFHDTVAENIRYGRLDSTNDEIKTAATQVGIAAYIQSLPDSFGTLIGDRGVSLSGGQQQRVAIARAILKDANIIVLDEATSALDTDSEKSILEHLCQSYADKIIILISHRLSAIRNMDEIVCMDRGCVVECGNHEVLIARKGFYWDLFREQME